VNILGNCGPTFNTSMQNRSRFLPQRQWDD